MDHPRLYWSVHCTPGTEWARFTPIEVPRDRVWTGKDDARYLSSLARPPGGKHTLGLARHWHFASVVFWVGNGAAFYVLLFATGQWQRVIPTSWQVLPDRGRSSFTTSRCTCRRSRTATTRTTRSSSSRTSPRSSCSRRCDPHRPVDVARARQSVRVVPAAARQPTDRSVASLHRDVRVAALHRRHTSRWWRSPGLRGT